MNLSQLSLSSPAARLWYFFILCVTALYGTVVQATVYYVSPLGSDLGAGTSTAPLETIQRAVDLAQPGDTVLVRSGSYLAATQGDRRVVTQRAGSPMQPILIKAENNATNLGGFNIRHSHVVIDGFTFTGTNCPRYQGFVSIGTAAHSTQVINNRFQGIGATGVSIYGVMFSAGGLSPDQSAQSCLISNNVFDTSTYIWVALFGRDHLVVSNTFQGRSSDFFRIAGASHVLRENHISGGGIGHTDLWQCISQTWYTATNITIESNFFDRVDSQVCQMEGANWAAVQSLRHEGTTAIATVNAGHFFREGEQITISGASPASYNGRYRMSGVTTNSFRYSLAAVPTTDATGTILAVAHQDIRDWTIRNNIFYHVYYHGNIMVPEVKWYNNVFWRCTTNVGYVLPCTGGGSGRADGTRILNNAFIGCGSPSGNVSDRGWYMIQPDLVDCIADYNLVANSDYSAKSQEPPRSSFVWWEVNGINGGNPGFLAPAQGDFRLTATSPLRDKGLALSPTGTDFTGALRSGVWDLGPFEYRTGAPPSPANLRRLGTP